MTSIFLLLFMHSIIALSNYEGFEIRHRRSRLMRNRRHGNNILSLNKIQLLTENSDTSIDNPIMNKPSTVINNGDFTFESNDYNNSYSILNIDLLTNTGFVKSYFKDNLFRKEIRPKLNDHIVNKTESVAMKMTEQGVDNNTIVSGDSHQQKGKENPLNINANTDIVTHFLRIVESQHLLGDNCTAGTDLSLGDGIVDRYAQERFRVEADVAVNRANMLTRLWKYAESEVMDSEYLLYSSVTSMVEFNDVIFAAGNCYDEHQYKDYQLFCPYAYRLPEGPILVKDLAVEYKYLSNTSEWFYKARKNAEKVIKNNNQFSQGFIMYRYNSSTHKKVIPEEILSVRYEDGKWSKPYYDCGGGNIWMLTYTVPFFGYKNNTYYFKGTSGIDIDLRHVDIDQCPLPKGDKQLNIFAASDKCKKDTTECVPIPGLGFRRGSYRCVCRRGFYFPYTKVELRHYNGTEIEEEYEKRILGEDNEYDKEGMFECLACPEGCDSCEDDRPCVVSLNWVMRTVILILSCAIICCLPIVVFFTWKYRNVKVVRAASPVLLRVIAIGAFFIYSTMIVMYPKPSVYTCTARIWMREIGFSLTYGALMLKTWRISVIFRVRSAKAIKITDANLLKRLFIILAVLVAFLAIRTIVAPPIVIIGRTADDLKAYLCKTDWWDHSFSIVEVAFLAWGIRLCIVVRKAPSEFNESRFISMAIYNEFLLSVFLNISMLFLQKPANPDLMYIIFFCHNQLTVTLLLCLIFGSKIFMVLKDKDKQDESCMVTKTPSKFMNKRKSDLSRFVNNSSTGDIRICKYTDQDIQRDFHSVYTQLEIMKEKNMRLGHKHIVAKIHAMQDAAMNYDIHTNRKSSHPLESSLCITPEHSTTDVQDYVCSSVELLGVCSSNDNGRSKAKTHEEEEKESSSAYPTLELKKPSENRYLKSGHAKTHSIVINLDKKKQADQEITV